MFEKGLDVPSVQAISGHKNPMILLNTYTKIKPETLVVKLGKGVAWFVGYLAILFGGLD